MRKTFILVMAASFLLASCCKNPGVFDQIRQIEQGAQVVYVPLTEAIGFSNPYILPAVIATDTALLLAGKMQEEWCPDPKAVAQLKLQADEAAKLTAQTGIVR